VVGSYQTTSSIPDELYLWINTAPVSNVCSTEIVPGLLYSSTGYIGIVVYSMSSWTANQQVPVVATTTTNWKTFDQAGAAIIAIETPSTCTGGGTPPMDTAMSGTLTFNHALGATSDPIQLSFQNVTFGGGAVLNGTVSVPTQCPQLMGFGPFTNPMTCSAPPP
jgi:hypothetical protein